MSKQYSEDEVNKNSRYRAERRRLRRDSQSRDSTRSRRSRDRHLSVRSELRDKPDVSKIARAVIRMTLAQAEADAQRDGQRHDESPERNGLAPNDGNSFKDGPDD